MKAFCHGGPRRRSETRFGGGMSRSVAAMDQTGEVAEVGELSMISGP